MALASQGTTDGTTAGGVPAGTGATDGAAAAPEVKTDPSLIDSMQKRINGLGRLVDNLTTTLKSMTESGSVSAPGPRADGAGSDKKGAVAASIEEQVKALNARMAAVNDQQVRTTILAAMVAQGMPEATAKIALPAMQKMGQFTVDESSLEVVAHENGGTIGAAEFVKQVMVREDWRGLIPAKPGAKPLPKGAAQAPGASVASAVQPNSDGVFSAAAVRAAAGM